MSKSQEETFPSVDLAYPIAVNSYDVALRRLEIMDGRLQTNLAFIVSVFGAFVTYSSSAAISFASGWFVSAAALCVINVAVGTWARFHGKTKLLRPKILLTEWLSNDQFTFKVDMIHDAAAAFEANMNLSNRKWTASILMLLIFALQVLAMVVWLVDGRP